MSDLLKIASIHWGFSIGGIAKYAAIIDKVKNYAPIEIITVCIISPKWNCDYDTLKKISAIIIDIRSVYDLSWIYKMALNIKSINPNLIMTHGFNGHFVAMAMKFLYKMPQKNICSYHGSYYAPTLARKILEKPFNFMAEYFFRHHAHRVISVSKQSKKYLVSKGVDSEKITVIHNGIEIKAQCKSSNRTLIRNQWGVKEEDILLGVASRLDPIKGISYLIDALAELVATNHNLRLVIIGTGPLENSLKTQVNNMGLTHMVTFTGFRSDIDDCLSAIDIFVLPSLCENHSIALLEAMRAKKAIVVTDVGGNTESVTHEKEGLVVPAFNSKALKFSIQRFIDDNLLKERLSENAYVRFKDEFETERMIRMTANLICSCL